MIKTRLIYPNAHMLVANHEPKPYFVHCYGEECQICRQVKLWKMTLIINRLLAMILEKQKVEKLEKIDRLINKFLSSRETE